MSSIYSEWQVKYIELCSTLGLQLSTIDLSKRCGVSRQSIYNFKRDHPEIPDVILRNLKGQLNQIGAKALQSLYARLDKSDKLIQLALEISQIYVPRNEVTNRYDTMEKSDVIKDIQNQYKRLSATNNVHLPILLNTVTSNETTAAETIDKSI